MTHAPVSARFSTKTTALLAIALFAGALSIWGCWTPQVLFGAVGMWCLVIVLLPYWRDARYEMFSPWSFVVLTTLIGCTLRGLFIAFNWPDEDSIQAMYLLDARITDFHWGWAVLMLGLLCLVLGYGKGRLARGGGRGGRAVATQGAAAKASAEAAPPSGDAARASSEQPRAATATRAASSPPPSSPAALKASERFEPQWLLGMTLVILVVSPWATYTFIQQTGGFSSDKLSAKRTVISDVDIEEDEEYRGHGMLKRAAGLSMFAHLYLLAHFYIAPRQRAWWHWPLILGMFLIGCLAPIYSSKRADVAVLFCCSLATASFAGKRLHWGKLALYGVSAILALHALTVLRSQSHHHTYALDFDVLDSIVLNRNFLGISKTALVIDAVPERLEMKWGETFYALLFSPIPREVWPNKPLVTCGPIIGQVIYGNRVSGVPPGLIAELYWNFHLPGVLVGCWLFGRFMRWMQNVALPPEGSAPSLFLPYVVGPMQVGMFVLSTTFVTGMFNMLLGYFVMRLLLWPMLSRSAARSVSPDEAERRLAAT